MATVSVEKQDFITSAERRAMGKARRDQSPRDEYHLIE
jgi:hypothetical protein